MIVAEGPIVLGGECDYCWLQWGRNLIVAEGLAIRLQPVCPTPLQWGRNLIVAEGKKALGATGQYYMLQWGRNLIVAEGTAVGLAEHPGDDASMGPQLDSCGRITAPRPGRTMTSLASMGPQLDSCGRTGTGGVADEPATGFNGAAT